MDDQAKSPPNEPPRYRLPTDRHGITHKFTIEGHKGYITYSVYPDGKLGEFFVKMDKQGSSLSGLTDAVAIAVSVGLQYGIPLKVFATKFRHTRFGPHGLTETEAIPLTGSVLDYVFTWLERKFPNQ